MSAAPQTESLIRAMYPELRAMAGRFLQGERSEHTLQRTALAHETFLRLLGALQHRSLPAKDLIAVAAHQMRQILVDYGRKHGSRKRGGGLLRVPLLDA